MANALVHQAAVATIPTPVKSTSILCSPSAPLTTWLCPAALVSSEMSGATSGRVAATTRTRKGEAWRTQNSELRSQKSEVRSQNSELRTQNSELRSQNSELRTQNSE